MHREWNVSLCQLRAGIGQNEVADDSMVSRAPHLLSFFSYSHTALPFTLQYVSKLRFLSIQILYQVFVNPDSLPGFCQSRFFTRFLSIQILYQVFIKILYQVFINPDSLPGFYQSRFFTRVLSIQILDQVFINPDSWPLIVFWLALWFSSIPEGIGSFGEHEGWFSTGPLPLFSAYGGRRRRMSKKKKKGGGWGGGEEAY